MRALRFVVACLIVLGLTGCGSDQPATIMPDVTGQRLDVALSDIERAGFKSDVEVLGGGMFGVIDESNWEVCDQSPTSGTVVTDAPRLTVDRSCGDTAEESPEPEAETTDPGESASASAIDAQAIEQKFRERLHNNFIDDFGDMCDDAYTHWACFYRGVDGTFGFLEVILTTDGGWSEAALDEMANATGRHWFNFIGCDYPGLSVIVVTINGLEHNVFRSTTSADSMCG